MALQSSSLLRRINLAVSRGRQRNSLLSPTAGVVGGMVLGQLVLFGLTPAITRIYDPALFGLFSIYLAVTAFDVGVCFGYDKAIPLPANRAEGMHLVLLSVLIASILSLTGLAAVFVLETRTQFFDLFGDLGRTVYFIPVSIIVMGLFQALVGWAIREQDFRSLSLARFCLYSMTGISQLAFGLVFGNAHGLIAGHIVGFLCGSIIILARTAVFRALLETISAPELLRAAHRYRVFAKFGAPAAVLSSFGLQLPTIAVAVLHGPVIAGLYSLAMRVFGVPLSLVGQALGQTLRAKLSDISRGANDRESFVHLLKSSLIIQGAVVFLLILISIVAPDLFAFIFGQDWRDAGSYMQLLMPMMVAALLVVPLHSVIDVMERPVFHMVREIVRVFLLVVIMVVASKMQLSASHTVFSISIAGMMVYVVSGFLVYRLVAKQ